MQGEKFSPKIVENELGIKFSEKNEPGEIGVLGRYKGKKYELGGAILKSPEGIDESLNWILNVLCKHKNYLLKCGVEDINLTLNIEYENQCNFELTKKHLSQLTSLNIGLAITCYKN